MAYVPELPNPNTLHQLLPQPSMQPLVTRNALPTLVPLYLPTKISLERNYVQPSISPLLLPSMLFRKLLVKTKGELRNRSCRSSVPVEGEETTGFAGGC
jgi:hypothetical protein